MDEFRRAFTGIAMVFEPSEKFSPVRGDSGSLWRYIAPVLRTSGSWTRIFVTSLLIQGFALAIPLFVGALVDRVVPRQDYRLLLVLGIALAGLVLFQVLTSLIRSHMLLHLRTVVDAHMTLGFLDHLVDLPYLFFQRRSAGDLMLRLNSNTIVREIVTTAAFSTLFDGTLVTLYLAILLIISPPIALVALILGLAQVGIFLAIRRRQRELMSESLQKQSKSASYQFEMLSGIETLKAMGSEQRAVEHWSDLFVDVLNVSLARGRLGAKVGATMGGLGMASPLLILGYGATLVMDGTLTLGTMLAISALTGGFLAPLSSLVSTGMQFQLLGSYLERINDVLDSTPEQDREKVRPAGTLRGGITIEKLSFRYGALGALAVEDVSADIRPGESVAIVGRSGAGKSTLAGLIVGLYEPTSGRVLFDGQDLADLDIRSVRRQIGVVTQHPYLFGTSVRGAIALADPSIPLDDIVLAARLAHIDDDIMDMPLGYDTLLVDGGVSLSGGQRQRLALARALVQKPAILLLDEATNALDAITIAGIHKELATMDATRIVVAQRLDAIVDADTILVVEAGRIVERGSHAALLQLEGTYAALFRTQAKNRSRVEMD